MEVKNFTFKELIKTNTGLSNIPTTIEEVQNIVRLSEFLQEIRNHLGKPITIDSAFRTKEVNEKVGGVSTSDHLLGLAADIKSSDMKTLYEILKSYLKDEIGQLIIYPTFYHVSINRVKHKGELLDKRK